MRHRQTFWSTVCLVLFAAVAAAQAARAADLAFHAAGAGFFEFDTGTFRGRLKLDGKYQGLYPLIDSATGTDLVAPPGALSLYRVFTTNRRYGDGARDWPTTSRLLDDGGVEVRWPPADDHPLAITAVYRWSTADTLDLEIAVEPQQALPAFELFLSSYFGPAFRASVLVRGDDGSPIWQPVNRGAGDQGGYVIYPRDDRAAHLIRDGRWSIPPSPVDWAMPHRLAAPVILRRDDSQNLTALMICPPQDCFAVASPWNPATPAAAGYRSLYQSLFGRDLAAGESARARCRLILRRGLANEDVPRCYAEYVGEPLGR